MGAVPIRQRVEHRLFPAVPVPLRADGSLDPEAQATYARWMADQPIGGVATWAHTGRGLKLDRATRLAVLQSWRSALGPQHALIAAAGISPEAASLDPSAQIDSAAAMAQEADNQGADALLVHPPTPFRARPDADDWIVRYHKAIAEAAPSAGLILFHLYEAAGGISYSEPLLERLIAIPSVFAIKLATLDSIVTVQDVGAWLAQHHPDTLVLSGEDRFLGYSLLTTPGPKQALVGMGATFTKLQARLLTTLSNHQADEFLQINTLVDDFGRLTFCHPLEGYIQRLLWCLVEQGILPDSSAHDPWCPALPSGERERIVRGFAELRHRVAALDPSLDA